ncbi:hypothetical protein C0J08_20920 [Marinomonas sp. CT5]|uniref:TIGR00180 family glycosyltransferase n=1 Tax=Marinomonas sp. CT5 TaxID=2066133 RepID=UPI001BAFFC99|nr:TIGR00180 family glycosyltransferase [Marinomonas sp. CT5]QUX97722.1 hypothetical protein C0J08_20920 [Marinomonas sp. CT5]
MLGIVIPTMNRSEFVIRQLNYYAEVGSPFTVYVGDSSNQEHIDKMLLAIENLKGKLKVVYKLYPNVSGPMCLKNLIGIVEENYAAFSGDDDFLVPRFLSKGVDFLEKNPEYRTVQGKGISFELTNVGPYGKQMAVTPYYLKNAEEETPSQRLQAFLANYWVPLFSVHRTSEFLEDHANLEKLTDIAFTEIMANCCTIISGKSKLLDDLYVVRQCHPQRHLLAKHQKWIESEQWQPSYEVFLETLQDALVKAENISPEDALSTIKESFDLYLHKNEAKERQNLNQKKSSVKSYLKEYFPGLKTGYLRVKSFFPQESSAISLDSLKSKSSPYNPDFMPLYKTITQG